MLSDGVNISYNSRIATYSADKTLSKLIADNIDGGNFDLEA